MLKGYSIQNFLCILLRLLIFSVNRYQPIMAMIFNSNKDQLLESILQKIKQIDAQCATISNQIYQYSDERVADLGAKAQSCQRQVKELEKQKNEKMSILIKLKKDVEFLKGEGEDTQKQLSMKESQRQKIEHSVRLLQQRYKEEAPHLQNFLNQKGKSKQNSAKVRYAKQKLKKLNDKLKKEWEEVQYQHRLNILIKQQIKQLGKTIGLSNESKGSKGMAMNSVQTANQTPIVQAFKQGKNTEFSEYYTESMATTFRD